MNNKKIDYNGIIGIKKELEGLYNYFKDSHNDVLKIIEDIDCVDDNKIEEYQSVIKEFESLIELIKSDFHKINSYNKKIESKINQTKLLKKKRLSKMESKMDSKMDSKIYDGLFVDSGDFDNKYDDIIKLLQK